MNNIVQNNNTNTNTNNIIKNKIIIQNTKYNRYHLNLYINNKLMEDYLSLKDSRHVLKDSVLLRPLIRIGLTGAIWLNEAGLLTFHDGRLSKILNGLSLQEKEELLELLKVDLQV